MENPYSPPQAAVLPDGHPRQRRYGGIGRLAFFGISVVLGVVQNVTLTKTLETNPGGGCLLALVFVFLGFLPSYYRLKNIGMSPWWCLLLIVPVANLLVIGRCLVCQEGWADTRKLDVPGKIALTILLGFFGLLLVVALIAIVAS